MIRYVAASVLGALVSMALGFVLHRVVFGSYIATQLDPSIVRAGGDLAPAILAGQLAFGVLATALIVRLDARSPAEGALVGGVLGLLATLWFTLTFYGSWEIFTLGFVALDSMLVTVRGAAAGALIGWIVGEAPAEA